VKLKQAFIQAEGGIPASDTFFRAWEGFRKRGVRCELFEPQQLREAIPLHAERAGDLFASHKQTKPRDDRPWAIYTNCK
jgi:hypothetical protein